jgi:integrase
MARQPKPWFRAERNAWFAQVNGKQRKLAEGKDNKALAQKELYRLLATESEAQARDDLTVAEACDLFLEHSKAVHADGTYIVNMYRLQVVCDEFGKTPLRNLKPASLLQWLARSERGKRASSSTRRGWLTALRQAIKWCMTNGHYGGGDPLLGLKMPKMEHRDRTLTPDERQAVLDACGPEFRDLLVALGECGPRPHILMQMEAKDIDWGQGVATVVSKRQPYTVMLTDRLARMLREKAESHPEGPLFRNTKGKPWTRTAVRCQFKRICDKLGIPIVTAYAFRHSFITDALERGINPAAVAALVNHKDLSMISKHYNHLAERRGVLKDAAECASASSSVPPAARPRPGTRRRAPR